MGHAAGTMARRALGARRALRARRALGNRNGCSRGCRNSGRERNWRRLEFECWEMFRGVEAGGLQGALAAPQRRGEAALEPARGGGWGSVQPLVPGCQGLGCPPAGRAGG